MALVIPDFDTRSVEAIRDELVARIPFYTPEWTDHNRTDPGIALLELFAFLAKGVAENLNQIPDATFNAFLRLLDIPLHPAQAARVLAAATTEAPRGQLLTTNATARVGPVVFQAEDSVHAWPVEAVGFVKKLDPVEHPQAEAQARTRYPSLGSADISFFIAEALDTQELAADSPIAEVSKAADSSFWIALLATVKQPLTAADREVLFRAPLTLGFLADDTISGEFELVPPSNDPQRNDRFACDSERFLATDWRIWSGNTPASSKPVSLLADDTRGLTRSGTVKLDLPHIGAFDPTEASPTPGEVAPPTLDDPEQRQRLLAWIQVTRSAPATTNSEGTPPPLGPLRWVGANVIPLAQQQTAAPELLGIGNGDEYQTYSLAKQNVMPGSLHLVVEEVGGRFTWSEVEDLSMSGRDDRHYQLDRATGTVRFGRNKRPTFTERIVAETYRYGGGAAGNVAAGAITKVSDRQSTAVDVKANNPIAATGGKEPETTEHAIERIPAFLRTRERAVTEEDFRSLASDVAGVGRAEVLASFHPDVRTGRTPGTVSVVVWPELTIAGVPRPQPSQQLIRAVCAHLDARRLVTTELYVIPPSYRPLALSIAVQVRAGFPIEQVRAEVERRVQSFMSPLPPGGVSSCDDSAGAGWPLGGAVRLAELQAVASRVDGVDFVSDAKLWEFDTSTTARKLTPVAAPGVVTIKAWQVPALVELAVEAGTAGPAAKDLAAEPITPTGAAVSLPSPRSLC